MVEFVLVFPVFMLCILGIIQLAVIFMNSFMLQYTAYMVARVAAVYDEDERMEKAERALGILKLMTYYSNSISGNENLKDKMKDVVYDASIDYSASYINGIFDKNSGNLRINDINIEAAQQDKDKEGKFIKVTVTQNLALKVPFVNKIFGLFNTSFKPELPAIIRDLMTLNIFNYDFSEIPKVLLNQKFPYYTIRASAIMRVE